MSLPSDINPQLLALSSGYNLTRSLRFRASATAYLSRTITTNGTSTTWTYSTWVKRGTLGAAQDLFAVRNGTSNIEIVFMATNSFGFYVVNSSSFAGQLETTQVFRDPSAWYHIVGVCDTTNATAANRLRLYVNGTQVTAFSTATYPTQNATTVMSQTAATHTISSYPTGSQYFDGYIAETNFIDGQALTPSSFGSTNALTGVWQPARYTGTYGTNGFYLPFTDNSALTTASNVGLGKDFSGNGNYWVTNNISITAGATYDSMTDVPTLTSATAANFAVLNPLDTSAVTTISNGNLYTYLSASGSAAIRATIASTSGKFYWEVTFGATGDTLMVGVCDASVSIGSALWTGANAWLYYSNNGNKYLAGSGTAYGATFTANDVIGVALDLGAGTLVFYKNNTSQGTAFSSLAGKNLTATIQSAARALDVYVNFGQRPFTYTPPTGYVALNTYNLPTSTIVKGNTVMDATLYTGNATVRSITNTAGFQPNLVWIKSRSNSLNSGLMDSVRGATKLLISNATNAEQTLTDELTSFNSNGFSLGASTNGYTNYNVYTYVGWQWLKSAAAGFDIVTFTGNGGGQTFVHNLGVAPGLMICKSYNNAENWYVYHSSIGGTGGLSLNTTAATATSVNYWSNVTPSSSTFSVGGNFSNGYTYVNYLFAPIAGFSAFGSYTGNGSTDGPFVYTGFRPKWVMVKSSSAIENWAITDSARSPFNAANALLRPDETSVENTGPMIMDFNSNGFKMRNSDSKSNGSGTTYIYMAFAENPFKNSLAR